MNPAKRSQGLTLVEIVVAIGVFSVIMLALSGTIVQGLQLRRNNSVDAQANAYAASVLERYKNFYAVSKNFDDRTSPVFQPVPPALKEVVAGIDTTITCINKAGAEVASDCELLRVSVTVRDFAGKARTNLVTEIGNPLQ
jgi:prepilin-type N-terminal cleavage/methylation domain-containing protein